MRSPPAQLLGLEPAWDRPRPGLAGPFSDGAFFCATLDLVAELAGGAAAPNAELGHGCTAATLDQRTRAGLGRWLHQVRLIAAGLRSSPAAWALALALPRFRPVMPDPRSQVGDFPARFFESAVEFAADGRTLCFSGPTVAR